MPKRYAAVASQGIGHRRLPAAYAPDIIKIIIGEAIETYINGVHRAENAPVSHDATLFFDER